METQDKQPPWKVSFSAKAAKQAKKLPPEIRDRLFALKLEMEQTGPAQVTWRNYGLIVSAKTKDVHHCHLNSGRPRYVAVWQVTSRMIQVIEILYAGPHGGVNYSHFR